MTALLWLMPIALFMSLVGLGAFLWTMRSGQYEDMEGAAQRILIDDDGPLPPPGEDAEADAETEATPPADPPAGPGR